uniref:DNA mismatch repair protein MutS clamp domain-containing protein n=1 Tax=Branchiostoma floridae TaxID=7739 RepID=C3YQP1_BRAFL|eukprot:XP_002601385.1 hypothetical protein BRAFLDRAFT_103449 [Branchiostoma floridae]
MRSGQASVGDWQALYKVDFEESTIHNRLVVKPHVDPELDEKKRTYNGLPDFMTRVAREELNKLDASITECNVIYLPQLGYLLAIPCTSQIIKEEEKYHMPGLEFVMMETIQDGEQLVFLYQLVDGVADSSYACTIAAQVGLPSELISRGAEVSELIRTNQPVHRVDTASTETQYQRCSEVVEEFLTLDLEKRDLVDFLKKFVSPKSQGKS